MAWNRNAENAAQPTPKKKPSALRGALAGLIVVALGAACFVMFSGKDAAPKAKVEKKPSAIKEVKPAVAPKTNRVEEAKKADDGLKPGQFRDGDRIFTPVSCTTNGSGYIDTVYVDQNGKRRHRIREKPSIWASETDRLLAAAISHTHGEMPPLPPMTMKEADAMFDRSLANPTEVKPGDSDEVRALKQTVNTVKMQVLDRIAKGEHFLTILQENRETLNDNWRVRTEAQVTLLELKKTASAEEVEKFVNETNAKLEKFGIAPIGVRKGEQQQ